MTRSIQSFIVGVAGRFRTSAMKSGNALHVSFPHLLVFVLYIGYDSAEASVNSSDPNACFTNEDLHKSVYRCCYGYRLDNSICVECDDGRYGSDCSYYCLCQNGGICNKTDGSCVCPQSHYGTHCDFPCPCKNNGTCNDDEGVFQSCTCKGGYYGDTCEKKCSCPNGTVCDPVYGCQCEHGTWGVNCSEVCNCQANMICAIADGSCRCNPGFYGGKCQHQCDCFNGGECGKANPNVCDCPSTWGGPDCTNCKGYESDGKKHALCEDKCLHCYNGNDCRPEKKTCNCTPGWHGDRCDQLCETGYYGHNCSQKCLCEGFERCNHVTGECSCHPGYFGQSCNQICPENCLECKKDTGDCRSCVTDWIGMNCDPPLLLSAHGINCTDENGKCICTESCLEICGSGSCDQNKAHTTEYDGDRHIFTTVIVLTCFLVFLVVIVAAWIYTRRQTEKQKSGTVLDEECKRKSTANYYVESEMPENMDPSQSPNTTWAEEDTVWDMNEDHSQALPKHERRHKYAAVNNRTSSESSGTSCSLEQVSLESSSLLERKSTTGSDVNPTDLPPNDDVTYTAIGSEIGSITPVEEALYDKIDRSGRRYREELPATNEYVTAASQFMESELSANGNGSLPSANQETDTATTENSNELRPPVAPKPRKRRLNTVQNKPTHKKSSTRRDYEEVPDETNSLLDGNPTKGNDVGQVDLSTDEDTTSSPTDPETNLAAAEEETFYDKVDRYGKQYRGERPADNEYATAGNHHIDSEMSGNENDSLAAHKQPSQKATVSEVNKIRVTAPPKPPRQYKYAVVNKPTSKQPSVKRHNYEDVPDETSSLLDRKSIAGNDVSPEDLFANEDCASGATDPDHVNAEGTMRIKQERSSKKKKQTLHHKYEVLENPDDVEDHVKVSPEPLDIPRYATVNKCSSKQSSAKPHDYADVLGEMRSLLKRKQSTGNDVSPTERSSNEDITSDETGPDNRSSEPDEEASYSKVDRSKRLYRAGRPVIHKYEDLLPVQHSDNTFATENESSSTNEERLTDNTTKQDGGSHYSEVDLIDGRNSAQRYLDVDRTGKKYRQKDGEKRSKYDNLTHHDDMTAYNDLDLNKIKKRSKPKTMPSEEQYNVLGENQATSPKYDKLGFFSFRKKRGTSEKKVIARGYSDV